MRSRARCRAQRTHYRQGLRCSTGSTACECAGCARAREHHKSDLSWRTSGRPDHSQPAITREQPSQPAPVVLQVQRFGSFVVRLWLLSATVTRHTAHGSRRAPRGGRGERASCLLGPDGMLTVCGDLRRGAQTKLTWSSHQRPPSATQRRRAAITTGAICERGSRRPKCSWLAPVTIARTCQPGRQRGPNFASGALGSQKDVTRKAFANDYKSVCERL